MSYHDLDLKKYPKSIPNNYVIFLGLGMILVMKRKSINQNIYNKIFTTLILKCLKNKTKYLQKTFTYFQVFSSNLKKHDYNNLTFEFH
jgi:hypothetical protein